MKIICEAKTIEKAKNDAMLQLGVKNIDDLKITVLEEESKGIFGFGSKNAKIEAELLKPFLYYGKEYIKTLLENMGIKNFTLEENHHRNEYVINVKVPLENKSRLIGKFGKTLDAVEYLTRVYINKKLSVKDKNAKFNVYIDIENYRNEKIEKLENLANKLAEKVLISGRSLEMKPMSARERKIIHMNFKNDPNINTISKGQDPYRKIVLTTKKNEKK